MISSMEMVKMDVKKILRAAKAQGWRIERTRKGHLRLVPPDPKAPMVIGSGNPSDHRAIRNLLAQMKRSGLVWPPR